MKGDKMKSKLEQTIELQIKLITLLEVEQDIIKRKVKIQDKINKLK